MVKVPGVVEMGLMKSGVVEVGLTDPGVVEVGLTDPGVVEMGLMKSGVVEMGLVVVGSVVVVRLKQPLPSSVSRECDFSSEQITEPDQSRTQETNKLEGKC